MGVENNEQTEYGFEKTTMINLQGSLAMIKTRS